MDSEDDVVARLLRLPDQLERAPALQERGRFLSVDWLVGIPGRPFRVRIEQGRIVRMDEAPKVMANWRFAYRARPEAWMEFWQPMPKAGWHDLLALTKRGAATLEGDLHPFIANLQYFKDLLALPREVRA